MSNRYKRDHHSSSGSRHQDENYELSSAGYGGSNSGKKSSTGGSSKKKKGKHRRRTKERSQTPRHSPNQGKKTIEYDSERSSPESAMMMDARKRYRRTKSRSPSNKRRRSRSQSRSWSRSRSRSKSKSPPFRSSALKSRPGRYSPRSHSRSKTRSRSPVVSSSSANAASRFSKTSLAELFKNKKNVKQTLPPSHSSSTEPTSKHQSDDKAASNHNHGNEGRKIIAADETILVKIENDRSQVKHTEDTTKKRPTRPTKTTSPSPSRPLVSVRWPRRPERATRIASPTDPSTEPQLTIAIRQTAHLVTDLVRSRVQLTTSESTKQHIRMVMERLTMLGHSRL